MFYDKKVYYSDYSSQEIFDLVSNITLKYYSHGRTSAKFEGKVKLDEFVIYPIFDYGPNEQLRPEIVGKILNIENGSKVVLTFQLSSGFKALLVLALGFNIFVMIMMGFLIPPPIGDKWWIVLIGLIITYISFSMYFLTKLEKSERLLKGILKLRSK